MINDRFPTIFGALVVLAMLAAPASAAEKTAVAALATPAHVPEIPERPALPTPGNTAEAEAMLGAKLLVCNTCHGGNGRPRMPNVPIVAGLQENYLAKQLHDFQTGDRESEVMMWMATALTPEEVGLAAAIFAKRNWPAKAATVAAATAPAAVAVCQICHQQNFAGGLPGPRLAGQNYEYLVEEMRRFADHERTNNTDMVKIMEAMSAADRDAMARYISGL